MTPLRLRSLLVAVGLVITGLTACSTDAKSSIDSDTQAQLRTDVAALAAAVTTHNAAAAQAALRALDTDAATARTAGKMSDAKLAQIRAVETTLETDLTASTPATAPPPTLSSTPTPISTPGKTKGKGNGNGNGHGGD